MNATFGYLVASNEPRFAALVAAFDFLDGLIQVQLCGNVAVWIVSHIRLTVLQTDLDSFKHYATLSEAIDVLTGPHMRIRVHTVVSIVTASHTFSQSQVALLRALHAACHSWQNTK